MMKWLRYSILALCVVTPAAAEDNEPLLPVDNRIRMLMYDENDIYTINTLYGYQTSIVLDPQEEIITISVGDRSLWQLIPTGNRLFIRPMDENVSTNMTIITNKRSYNFDIKSLGMKADRTSIVYVAKFVYPDTKRAPAQIAYEAPAPAPVEPAVAAAPVVPAYSEPLTTTEYAKSEPFEKSVMDAAKEKEDAYTAQREEAEAAKAVAPSPSVTSLVPTYPNYNYTFAGPDDLAPLQVYDDGKMTFIKYRDMSEPLPNVYVKDADGKETALPYEVKEGVMILDVVRGELLLKSSSGAVNIYNEMLNPS